MKLIEKRWVVSVFLLSILFAVPHLARAHAVLQKSQPAMNATVEGVNIPILLTYNSRVDAVHSSLALVGSNGKSTAVAVDQKAAPDVLQGNAHNLPPGHYTLRWQVVASDGHISRGVVPFSVR